MAEPTGGSRGDPRQRLCDHLRYIGVAASPGNITNTNQIWPQETRWLVDIAEGPIRHVLVWEEYFPVYSEAPDMVNRGFGYWVEDLRILENVSEAEADSGDPYGCWLLPGASWREEGGWGGGGGVPDIVESVWKHAPTRGEWERYESLARQQLASAFSGTTFVEG